MDVKTGQMVNSLLGNKPDDATLEITMTGPRLQFEEPTFIALGGAEMPAFIDGNHLPHNQIHQINPGDIISFGKLKSGLRVYMAIKGGIQSPEVLGSRSYFKSITDIDRVRSGDEIPYNPLSEFKPKISSIKTNSHLKKQQIDVHEGPEFKLLDPSSREQLFNSAFTIAKEYNRMAYQLQEKITSPKISMITSANLPGTVQLTPSGKLIILMRDGQTTGGYPRVLQLDEKAISVLAQKKFGDQILFKPA